MIILIMSILDLLSGAVLITNGDFLFFSSIVSYMAAYSLFKGVLFLLSSFGMGYYFDWMSAIDIITGIGLLLLMWGFSFGFFYTIAVIALLKGAYSFLRGFFRI
jgi:hypothetical protein